jgi:hypothetical protein
VIQKKVFKNLHVHFIILMFLSYLIPSDVRAGNLEQGITLWPTLQLISVKPGETKDINVHIKNTNDTTLEVTPEYRNLEIRSNPLEGFSILEEKNILPARWFNNITKIPQELQKGDEIVFKSSLSVPEDVENKGYYAVLLFHFEAKKRDSQVRATSEIGSALYITVGDVLGEQIQYDAYIKTFSVKPRINFSPRIDITTSVSNTGNIHYRPRGKVNIINPKGVIQADTPSFNEQLRYILPGQILNEETSWKDNSSSLFPPIGKYRVVFDLFMQEDRSFVIREETYFYVIPFQYLLILPIIFILFGTVLKLRKKKK